MLPRDPKLPGLASRTVIQVPEGMLVDIEEEAEVLRVIDVEPMRVLTEKERETIIRWRVVKK